MVTLTHSVTTRLSWPRNYQASIGGFLSVVHPREIINTVGTTCTQLLPPIAYLASPRLYL